MLRKLYLLCSQLITFDAWLYSLQMAIIAFHYYIGLLLHKVITADTNTPLHMQYGHQLINTHQV